jgi:hypothetical protein
MQGEECSFYPLGEIESLAAEQALFAPGRASEVWYVKKKVVEDSIRSRQSR